METIAAGFWLLGIALSIICFLSQILIYILVAKCRKTDLKLLTQITVARLLNDIFECVLTLMTLSNVAVLIILALYMYTDAAMICWMFAFTKNLYDKVVYVYTTKEVTFVLKAVLIWTLTIPFGLLCPIMLHLGEDHFDRYYEVYGILKFIVLTINLLCFSRIFWVAVRRKISMNSNSNNILRTCIVSFVLVSISSLQVLINDLSSYHGLEDVANVFSVINSYQVIAVTMIFLMLANNSCEESLKEAMAKGFRKLTF